MEIQTLDELIERLQNLKKEHGNLSLWFRTCTEDEESGKQVIIDLNLDDLVPNGHIDFEENKSIMTSLGFLFNHN